MENRCPSDRLVTSSSPLTRQGPGPESGSRYSQCPWKQGRGRSDHNTLLYGKAARSLGIQLGYPEALREQYPEWPEKQIIHASTEKAQKVVDDFFGGLPEVRAFIDQTLQFAAKHKYTESLLGRRRWFWDIMDWADQEAHRLEARNRRQKLCWCNRCKLSRDGDRAAVNNKIQGCLPATTRVLTAKGLLPIGDIEETGQVWTGSRWAPYTRLDRGEWVLATVTLSNGQTLDCDTRHQLLVVGERNYEFRKWEDLRPGDQVCLSCAEPLEYGNALPESLAYWMGFAVGNGCTSHGTKHVNALAVTFGDRKGRYRKEAKHQEFLDYAQKAGFSPQKPRVSRNKVTTVVESAHLRSIWESYGYPWGSTSHSKRVPSSIWSASLQDRTAFLLGLLDSDGHIGPNVAPNLHMCNRALLAEVQLLARTVGVETWLRGPYHYKEHRSWRLDLQGAQLTRLGYGFRKTERGRSLAPLFAATNFAENMLHIRVERGSDATLLSRMRGGGTVGIYTLKRMAEKYGVEMPIYATASVVETKTTGVRAPTYTLSVDVAEHRFDSEGVISKNTAADITMLAMLRCHYDQRLGDLGVHMLLQVHDELVFEIPNESVEEAMPIIQQHMEHPGLALGVPLRAPPSTGDNWAEAKD